MTTPPPIRAPKPTPLSGEEVVAGTDATVVDFWRFALSNLRMNNARGYLAEFLVAKAVGSTGLRIEWDPYDVLAPDGTTIEVKTSAYLQAWDQYKLSTIQFTGLRSRIWSTEGGLTPTPTYNADVYVFAIQTARTHEEYNPLLASQWRFHVLPKRTVEDLGQDSIGLATLERLAGPSIAYEELHDEIKSTQAHESNRTNTTEIYSKILPQRHAPTQSTRVIHHNDD